MKRTLLLFILLWSYTVINAQNGPTVWHDSTSYYWANDSTYIYFSAIVPYPSQNVKSISWTSNDGYLNGGANGYNAMFSFATPGTHTVTFTTTMKNSASGMYNDTSTTYEFTVRNPYVQHNSWHGKDTTIRTGDTLTLHAGNPGGTYYWENYDWTFFSEEETVKITEANYYGVSIQRNGDFCYDRIRVLVEDPLSPSPLSVVNHAVDNVTLGGNKVKAFPNPSAGQVSLQFEKPLLKAVTINVYNLNGRVMYTRTTTQQLQPLDLSGLPKGYYMIELTGYGQQKVLSLILQ